MRYQLFVKLKKSNLETPDKVFPKSESDVKAPQSKKIILENPDKQYIQGKNGTIENTDKQQDSLEPSQEETFQYQVPRLRASLTLKMNPNKGSVTPDKSTNTRTKKKGPRSENIPDTGNRQSNVSLVEADSTSDHSLSEYKPYPPPKPKINNSLKIMKPPPPNRSSYSYDDKDFEIPLEESLQAVEDFIKREQELAKWQVGEIVLAKWKGNGLYYQATILEILISGVITVVFDSYDVTEEIDYRDMCKYCRKTNNFKKKGRAQNKENPQTEIKKNETVNLKRRKRRNTKKYHFISLYKRANKSRKKRLIASHRKNRALKILRKKMNTWHL